MNKGVSINVASNSSHVNGRGRFFERSERFDYIPIPENRQTITKIPSYSDLPWLKNCDLNNLQMQVHLDPEFETYTYGHVKRGFGDMGAIKSLDQGDYLLFHATLSHPEYPEKWLTAIIGYFEVECVVECSGLSTAEIKDLHGKKFANNAHLKREDPSVDLLVAGTGDSRLLEKAIPLSTFESPRELRKEFNELFRTAGGKTISNGKSWCRWTLKIEDVEKLMGFR